ncbi:MAG: M15 family metallopeptidase, partial [Parcubacteria group bacterium]
VLVLLGIYSFVTLTNSNTRLAGEKLTLEENLKLSEEENTRLEQEVRDKQYIIDSFEGQIRSISNTVGDLDKLAKTDKELLLKYSKVYFLNENYIPERLEAIAPEYRLVENDTDMLVHASVWPYLDDMLEEAGEDGIDLLVSSAFRSFETQAAIKSGYKITYGTGANKFSADQGYSEHQLGTTVDLATRSSGSASLAFEKEPAFKWLEDNAHKYGFVLSYPKGNAYYIYEPWHWRFVGRDLARYLHEEDKNFYDLDQREIDKYLISYSTRHWTDWPVFLLYLRDEHIQLVSNFGETGMGAAWRSVWPRVDCALHHHSGELRSSPLPRS